MMFHNKAITLTLLLIGCCAFICAAQSDVSLRQADLSTGSPAVEDVDKKKTTSTPSPTTTTIPSTPVPETTTTNKPTTTNTTPKPKTTSATTTTTPPPPPPDTTTPKTTSTTPSTTPAPAPITTTPKPAPYPAPKIGTWNSSCIMIKMAAQLNFTYVTKDNKTSTALYNIPADAKVEDAHCDSNTTQSLQINWGPSDAQHSMVLQFDMVNKTSNMVMIHFIIPLTADSFPDAKDNETIQLIHRKSEFGAPVKMSYHCTRPQTFNLTEIVSDKAIAGTLTVRDVQTEAFRVNNSTGFSTARDCDSSETSDIVPIAVGIALVALIMIVLISYLCARRRSTSRGYMSF